MKPFALFSTAVALAALLTGCVGAMVPKTVIEGNIGGKPFRYSGPKDQTLALLTISADTNGTISIVVSNLTTKMNPDVISTTGKAQVDMINAIGTQLTAATAAAAKMAVP
jgi:hypothetical protein